MADTDIAVLSLVVVQSGSTLTATWTYLPASSPLPYLQIHHFEVWVATSNDRSLATKVTDSTDLQYALPVPNDGLTRYFWVRPIDISANQGDFYPLGSTAGVSASAFYPINLSELAADMVALNARLAADLKQAKKDLQDIQAFVADAATMNFDALQSVHQTVTAQTQAVIASYKSDIVAATGPNSAQVAAVQVLNAVLGVDGNASSVVVALNASATLTAANAAAILALQSTVNDPTTGLSATVTALSSLTTTVNNPTTGLSANGAAIIALQGQLGNTGASAIFQMDISGTPTAGWTSAGQLKFGVTAGGTLYSTGLTFEAKAGQARSIWDGDQLLVRNAGVVAALFTAGTTFIDIARIQNATITTAKIGNLQITNALLAAGAITAAKITAGTITANEIIAHGVNDLQQASFSGTKANNADTAPSGGTTSTMCSKSLTFTDYPAQVGGYIDFTTAFGTGTQTYNAYLMITISGTDYTIAVSPTVSLPASSSAKLLVSGSVCPPNGTYTLKLKLVSSYTSNLVNTINDSHIGISNPQV